MDVAQRREVKENLGKKGEDAAVPNRKRKLRSNAPKKRNFEVKPFSFYDRDMERLAKKEEKIRKIQEEERSVANSFRATPIIEDDPNVSLPPRRPRQVTMVEPFHFRSDRRAALKSKNVDSEEMRGLEERVAFKANTNYKNVLSGSGWKPKLEKKCTEFDEFSLNTESRACERQEFDNRMKERESLHNARLEEKKQHDELQEQELTDEMRRKAEFKAAPVRKYRELLVKESDKTLTVPQTPNFSKKFARKTKKSQ